MTGRRKDDFLTLRLSPEDHAELKRLAALEERTVAGMVRLAVRQLLESRKETAR